uniref:Ribosomal protein L23 n=1 Tax=Neolitsea homilantha TaxID=344105 RepID=A0A8F0LF06_9MAGN|nr:ribosomal protein L23 [Machilus chuanchienensis]QWL22993.1 ribosomal protein L23 [Neolitsea homilantha]UJH18601.1 ribosomal protein L23 [Machilus chuanchienensis]
MDGIKYVVFTEKSIRLLGNNQYTSNVESGSTSNVESGSTSNVESGSTSNVESGSTRTEIKHWVELFFGVKVINSHQLPGKG